MNEEFIRRDEFEAAFKYLKEKIEDTLKEKNECFNYHMTFVEQNCRNIRETFEDIKRGLNNLQKIIILNTVLCVSFLAFIVIILLKR